MRFSIKQIAEFMTSSPTAQRRILHSAKYSDEEEPQAKIHYYDKAIRAIKTLHKENKEPSYLLTLADRLISEADREPKDGKARIMRSNARVLSAYANTLATQKLEILPRQTFLLAMKEMDVNATPDLLIKTKSGIRFIKFDFTEKGWKLEMRKIVLQGVFEAVSKAIPTISPHDVVVQHIQSGKEYVGARMGSRLRSDIEYTCANIVAIWPTI